MNDRKPKGRAIGKKKSSEVKALDFESLIHEIEHIHRESQAEANRSVNRALVLRNWLIGQRIFEFEQEGAERAKYGTQLIASVSKRLKPLGRGFSQRSVEQFRRFYRAFAKSEIAQTPSAQTLSAASKPIGGNTTSLLTAPFERLTLSWSHYVTLLTIDNPDERSFYEIEANQNNWGVREFRRQLNSSLYQRLALSRDKDEIRRLATEGQIVATAVDLIKNPLVLEFLELDEKTGYSECDLETEIIDKLQSFLLELGKGFLFEARQRRFTFDDEHYYIDLVLYNRLLRCYVLLDLKLDKLTHGDLGQMQMYVNYFDRHVRLEGELPTIGILLCARKNDAMVELTLPQDANIFASKYQLYLPSKEELKRELEKIEAEIEEFGLERDE